PSNAPVSSPRIRKLAREQGVALEQVSGSGPHGRVTDEDLSRAAQSPATNAAPAPSPRPAPTTPATTPASSGNGAAAPFVKLGPRGEDVPRQASQMRKTIARRLTEAKQTVPHFYLEADLDVEKLLALR